MSKAGGVSNVELSTNLEKTCRMMSYHTVVRISYLVGRGSFRQKWMGGATAVLLNMFYVCLGVLKRLMYITFEIDVRS